MKILLYGSSHLTAAAYEYAKDSFEFVGNIPSKNPRISGIINLPKFRNPKECPHDIKLSIQYDRKILNYENAFNIHTGILPEWGGGDILYHTLKTGAHEQGITFHKMSKEFDFGPIISKITYPVFDKDNVLDLYSRMSNVLPPFVCSSLALLEGIGLQDVFKCHKEKPVIFKREKGIPAPDLEEYKNMGKKLEALYGEANEL